MNDDDILEELIESWRSRRAANDLKPADRLRLELALLKAIGMRKRAKVARKGRGFDLGLENNTEQ